jgi:hypothetical protein
MVKNSSSIDNNRKKAENTRVADRSDNNITAISKENNRAEAINSVLEMLSILSSSLLLNINYN